MREIKKGGKIRRRRRRRSGRVKEEAGGVCGHRAKGRHAHRPRDAAAKANGRGHLLSCSSHPCRHPPRPKYSCHRQVFTDVEVMNTIDGSNDSERAEQSCASCKRLKRRCSKDLPTCLLCSRVGRRCDYSTGPVTPTRSDPEWINARLQTRPGTPNNAFLFRSNVLPNPFVPPDPPREPSKLATCFLDSVATRGVDAALPCDLLWRDVCPGMDEVSVDEAASIINRYFSTTHSWLPVGKVCLEMPQHRRLMPVCSIKTSGHEIATQPTSIRRCRCAGTAARNAARSRR